LLLTGHIPEVLDTGDYRTFNALPADHPAKILRGPITLESLKSDLEAMDRRAKELDLADPPDNFRAPAAFKPVDLIA
jgi:hypothetical protein